MKVCNKCNVEKTLSEFSDLKGGKFGKRPDCKGCRRNISKEFYNKNSEGILQRQKANRKKRDKWTSSYWRKKKYGLSEEAYHKLLQECGEKCSICKSDDKLVVDHCHTTGKVRGLLCSKCNIGLGQFLDDTKLLEEAIEYLGRANSGV